MHLDRVTITGADDSVDPGDLLLISRRFPFVEWGILLSRSSEGEPRFPSLDWMNRLAEMTKLSPVRLSGHLCGSWVRELCMGRALFEQERPTIARIFQRVQLNFHAKPHEVETDGFIRRLREWARDEYIFQFDGSSNENIMTFAHEMGLSVAPLFDTSGGAGVYPKSWPSGLNGIYCGYAGGLHPEQLHRQLVEIAGAAGEARVWIDVETHVRSPDDLVFDLEKTISFLTAAEPWIAK